MRTRILKLWLVLSYCPWQWDPGGAEDFGTWMTPPPPHCSLILLLERNLKMNKEIKFQFVLFLRTPCSVNRYPEIWVAFFSINISLCTPSREWPLSLSEQMNRPVVPQIWFLYHNWEQSLVFCVKLFCYCSKFTDCVHSVCYKLCTDYMADFIIPLLKICSLSQTIST